MTQTALSEAKLYILLPINTSLVRKGILRSHTRMLYHGSCAYWRLLWKQPMLIG